MSYFKFQREDNRLELPLSSGQDTGAAYDRLMIPGLSVFLAATAVGGSDTVIDTVITNAGFKELVGFPSNPV